MPRTRGEVLPQHPKRKHSKKKRNPAKRKRSKYGVPKGERPADDRRRQRAVPPNRVNTDKPQPTTDLKK